MKFTAARALALFFLTKVAVAQSSLSTSTDATCTTKYGKVPVTALLTTTARSTYRTFHVYVTTTINTGGTVTGSTSTVTSSSIVSTTSTSSLPVQTDTSVTTTTVVTTITSQASSIAATTSTDTVTSTTSSVQGLPRFRRGVTYPTTVTCSEHVALYTTSTVTKTGKSQAASTVYPVTTVVVTVINTIGTVFTPSDTVTSTTVLTTSTNLVLTTSTSTAITTVTVDQNGNTIIPPTTTTITIGEVFASISTYSVTTTEVTISESAYVSSETYYYVYSTITTEVTDVEETPVPVATTTTTTVTGANGAVTVEVETPIPVTTTTLDPATLASGACISDNSGYRPLTFNGLDNGYTDDTANRDCSDYCYDRMFSYSGTENGVGCWCGDEIYSYYAGDATSPTFTSGTVVSNSHCNVKCAGDEDELCGGKGYLSFSPAMSLVGETDSCGKMRRKIKRSKELMRRNFGFVRKSPRILKRYYQVERSLIWTMRTWHRSRGYPVYVKTVSSLEKRYYAVRDFFKSK